MKKRCFPISALMVVGIQLLAASPLAASPGEAHKTRSLEFRVNVLGGFSANLGGIEQVSGQGVGSSLFNNSDYFQGIGRNYLIPSSRAGLDFDLRLNGKNDFLLGVVIDQRILRFDYIKIEAPTDLEYCSDFRYLELSVGYSRNIGEKNYYIGMKWQKNILLYNDSYIQFDGGEYLSVLEDALNSESVSLFFGRRFAISQRDELNASLGIYCDTTEMYPLNSNGPIARLIFLGLLLNVSWSLPAI